MTTGIPHQNQPPSQPYFFYADEDTGQIIRSVGFGIYHNEQLFYAQLADNIVFPSCAKQCFYFDVADNMIYLSICYSAFLLCIFLPLYDSILLCNLIGYTNTTHTHLSENTTHRYTLQSSLAW